MGLEGGDGFNRWLAQELHARLGSISASGPPPERAPFHAAKLQGGRTYQRAFDILMMFLRNPAQKPRLVGELSRGSNSPILALHPAAAVAVEIVSEPSPLSCPAEVTDAASQRPTVRVLVAQDHVLLARKMLLAEFAPRELDVLHLLAEGLDTATMAQRLGIAPHTVEWHVKHVIEKLRVHSKLQAVNEAARKGLIEL
jgi:DNA-binding CsgD family transcriptional regulator